MNDMNKSVLLLLVSFTMVLVSFAPAETWTKYISKEGHYSIEFPGQPAETKKEDTTGGGKAIVLHYATWFPNDSEGYMADWADLRRNYPENKTIKQILEQSRDGAMRSLGAANVITTAIIETRDPYIAFAFTSTDFTGRGRIYIINKFQYSIITLFSRNAGISKDADRFIRSFKYLP